MKQLHAVLALAVLVCGCTKSEPTAAAAGPADAGEASQVAAKIGSRSLTNAELDARLQNELKDLAARTQAAEEQVKAQLDQVKSQHKEQEFNLRKKALTEMLLDIEAKERGLTRQALIAQELTAKAQVTPADIDAMWEEVKSRARGATKEQVMPQLSQMVAQRKTETRGAALQLELFKKHDVSLVGLQPARKNVTYPSDAPMYGPKDAPITLVEFTDYQCPYCQQAQQYVDRVLDSYKDKVKLVYQEFPLDFHGQAKPAGVAARCAGEQGKFWEMHRSLLLSPGPFDTNDLKARAVTLGIDPTKFSACTTSGKYDPIIQKAIDNGLSVGVTGTPTFFLNGRSFTGAQPFEYFERMILEELAMADARAAGR